MAKACVRGPGQPFHDFRHWIKYGAESLSLGITTPFPHFEVYLRTPLPLEKPETILVWHQGALGDLLLAGPALEAICRHYPGARLIGVGHPKRWRLLANTLPLAAIWDGGEALWAGLFLDEGPLSATLTQRLAGIDLALVFSPRPRPGFLARLEQGGVAQALWIPSFPEGGRDHVVTVQGRRLAELGLGETLTPFRLRLDRETDPGLKEPILAVAPGSSDPNKNWPLSHFYEVTRTLAWNEGLQVVWLAGPAEEQVLPYLQGLARAQDHVVWYLEPLERVARLLTRSQVYLGGDSGLTHLAVAAGTRLVVALFGPTDPRVWAPLGDNVTVLTPPMGAGSGTSLADLSLGVVLAEIKKRL